MVELEIQLRHCSCKPRGYHWARARPGPASLRHLVEIDASGMLELLQSSVFMKREQILRELELLYIYLFQQILILYHENPTIVSGLQFFQNLHNLIPFSA
jgi:hypothetical protein